MIISDTVITFTPPIPFEKLEAFAQARGFTFRDDSDDNEELVLETPDGGAWSTGTDDDGMVELLNSSDGGNMYDADDVESHVARAEEMTAALREAGFEFTVEDSTDEDQDDDTLESKATKVVASLLAEDASADDIYSKARSALG